MGRLSEMSDAFGRLAQSVSDGSILRDTLRRSPSLLDDMVEMQNVQLDQGLSSRGTAITPSVLDDPFFRSPETAEKYAAKKVRMRAARGVVRNGNADAPDLFLTGYFRSGFFVRLGDAELQVQNDNLVPDRRGALHDVYAKYGAWQFGLTEDNWDVFLRRLTPRVCETMREML